MIWVNFFLGNFNFRENEVKDTTQYTIFVITATESCFDTLFAIMSRLWWSIVFYNWIKNFYYKSINITVWSAIFTKTSFFAISRLFQSILWCCGTKEEWWHPVPLASLLTHKETNKQCVEWALSCLQGTAHPLYELHVLLTCGILFSPSISSSSIRHML